jgi:hypothetical protein
VFIGALGAAAVVTPMAAQPKSPCMECRALAHFRTCDRPMVGSLVFRGSVVGIERAACSDVLVLDVTASPSRLPRRVWVDLGPCAVWAGQPGDVIDIAVREPGPEVSRYSLACRLW